MRAGDLGARALQALGFRGPAADGTVHLDSNGPATAVFAAQQQAHTLSMQLQASHQARAASQQEATRLQLHCLLLQQQAQQRAQAAEAAERALEASASQQEALSTMESMWEKAEDAAVCHSLCMMIRPAELLALFDICLCRARHARTFRYRGRVPRGRGCGWGDHAFL